MAWSTWKPPKAPANAEELTARWGRIVGAQEKEKLPGFNEQRSLDPKIVDWLETQEQRVRKSIADVDELLFEKAVDTWLKACARVNEIVANAYRASHPDSETWELRYLKWMTGINHIKFDSSMGEFWLYPRRPRRRPETTNWYTVDEMIDMLDNSAIVHAIKTFGKLPGRPEELSRPGVDEKHAHVDLTQEPAQVTFDFKGGPRREGKGFR